MFQLQHQFNNIIETTQLAWIMIRCQNSIVTANVGSIYCQLQATTSASSRLIWEIFYSLVDRSLWQVVPDNLKCFLEFGACFQLCFKLAVSLQHCTPYIIVHWVYIWRIWRPLVFCDDIWTAGLQPVPCAVLRCALCVLTCHPAGWWIWWAAGDCFEATII